jgi:hypothetical protein
MTYPSGWAVLPRLIVKRERWPGGYQARGVPLVYSGQEVVPDQPVLSLQQAEQEKRYPHTLLSSPVSYALPPLNQNIPAGLHGRVIDFTARGGVIIESHVALCQGTLGAGNQVAGVITIWQPPSAHSPQTIPPGAILIVPRALTFGLMHQALNSGVVGVIASSIALRDLEGFLQTDYLQLVRTRDIERAQSQLPPLTLLLTEGIGSAIMPTHVLDLFQQYQGSIGLLTGIRSLAQNRYPELIISIPQAEVDNDWLEVQSDTTLFQGAQVRICGGEHNGTVGRIDYFFTYEQAFSSGLHTRAVRLLLDDGSFFVIPATMIERIS